MNSFHIVTLLGTVISKSFLFLPVSQRIYAPNVIHLVHVSTMKGDDNFHSSFNCCPPRLSKHMKPTRIKHCFSKKTKINPLLFNIIYQVVGQSIHSTNTKILLVDRNTRWNFSMHSNWEPPVHILKWSRRSQQINISSLVSKQHPYRLCSWFDKTQFDVWTRVPLCTTRKSICFERFTAAICR